MPGKNAIRPDRLKGLGLVRVLNEQTVLETILRNGEVSRPMIAGKTGLSLPTVVSLVDTLENIGLVREEGLASGSVGRPATLYSVDPRAGYVFAVHLGGSNVRAGITDLVGEVISERVEPTASTSADAIMAQLERLYSDLLAESDFALTEMGAACVSVPGVWDPETDRISAAYNLPHLNDVYLQATIEETLGLPVIIENDVNLAAIGESWKGRAREYDTFVSFFVGTGIGMGIVIDGEVYRGHRGAAGEVGLLPIGPDPFDSRLRRHGPLETAASEPSLRTRVEQALEQDQTSLLAPDADMGQIIAASAAGDAVGTAVLDEEARSLAVGVAAVVAVLDPAIVILGGRAGAHAELANLVHHYAAQLVPWMPPVEASILGDRATFYGAVAIGLQAARENILVKKRSSL